MKAAGYALVQERNPQGMSEWQNPKDSSVMILLPPANGKPGLLVGKFEVTLRQYRIFLEGSGIGGRYEPYDLGARRNENEPIIFLEGFQAQAYARWAGGRLPSEEEWVRAALGDAPDHQGNAWPWGPEGPSYRRANYDVRNNRNENYAWREFLKQVTEFAGSESPIGARQMAGNAAEYVELPGGKLGLKGGAWCNHPDSMRVTAQAVEPGSKNDWKAAGMRLFADLP